jgi:bifunctional DNA-binding transcriptional regulator/antitoxin component of YhaV-PrlF toxin-antitoxin module
MLVIRKVQQNVSGSYLFTLPKEWVEQQGLKKGDVIGIKELDDGSLILKKINDITGRCNID